MVSESEEIASIIVDTWEIIENETMRDAHRHTLEQIIVCVLEKRCYTLPNGDCVSPTCIPHSSN